jgi:hypothetical protein
MAMKNTFSKHNITATRAIRKLHGACSNPKCVGDYYCAYAVLDGKKDH